MQPLGDNYARWLLTLTAVVELKLIERQKANEEQNRKLDSEEYRKTLAESHPELVRQYEQLTAEEWEEGQKQHAMAQSVAYAILWAMEHLHEHPQ